MGQQRENGSRGQESWPQGRGTWEPNRDTTRMQPSRAGAQSSRQRPAPQVLEQGCPRPSFTLTLQHIFDPSLPVEDHGAVVVDVQEGDLFGLLS